MKIVWRIVGVIVICLVLALVVLSITGLDPKGYRPGLWLRGQTVSSVPDWSFANKYPQVLIETGTPYLIPHSVTISAISADGNLYLHSAFPAGRPFPSGKQWTAALTRDPHVRIKIGDQVFDRTATYVTDPAELASIAAAQKARNPRARPPANDGSTTYYFLVRHD